MSNSKHSPGPWSVKHHKKNNILFILSENGYVAMTPDFGTEKQPHEFADAARIVTCVNAMEGIEDPAKLLECFDDMLSALKAVTKQLPGMKMFEATIAEAELLRSKS